MTNRLYYGDNLAILRDHVADGSVDLVYLDPPFNSNATYNVLFRAPDGQHSQAQIEAFEDTWHWNEAAEDSYWRVLNGPNTDAARMLEAMRGFLGDNDMMAYLAMMAIRLIELHRVLKPTGSLYLHCDPTASHYLKILLDAVFGARNFRNEVTWKRTTTHSDSRTWSKVADTILFYSRGTSFTWNIPRSSHTNEYVASKYRHDDGDGRLYMLDNMTSPNPRPNMMYEWNGFPFPSMGWRYSKETMARLDSEKRIWYPHDKSGKLDTTKRPRLKRYLDETPGGAMGAVWTDVSPLNSQAQERLGYPTQKPLALLERIISTSSNKGDLVLDPFCGCGTTVHAAQKLGRRWIGIDITHLAIALVERRLREAFAGIAFETVGVPKDIGAAAALADRDKHEFEKWAISLVPDAQPFRGGRKGADSGIDGVVYFKLGARGTDTGKAIVSVKGGRNIQVSMVRDLKAVVEREKALIGLFLTLAPPTRPMTTEAAAAGFVELDQGRFAKIQILTIAGLLDRSERPQLPVIASPYRAARREEEDTQGDLAL